MNQLMKRDILRRSMKAHQFRCFNPTPFVRALTLRIRGVNRFFSFPSVNKKNWSPFTSSYLTFCVPARRKMYVRNCRARFWLGFFRRYIVAACNAEERRAYKKNDFARLMA